MEKGTILIVDDNKGVLASLELLLETEFSEIKTAHHPNQIISILNTSPVDVIILDMNFSAGINNGNEGLYWLKRIREIKSSGMLYPCRWSRLYNILLEFSFLDFQLGI